MQYESARWSTPVYGCRSGAMALRDYTLGQGFASKGCFNDRGIRGALSKPSLHREGRAIDIWWGDRAVEEFDGYVNRLRDHYEALGIQQIIWSHRVWTVGRGDGWRSYNGASGTHEDHAHVELTWDSAHHLTTGRITEALGPKSTGDDDMASTLLWDCDEGNGVTTGYWWDGEGVISLFRLPVVHYMIGMSGKVLYGGKLSTTEHNVLIARLTGGPDPDTGQVGTWGHS